jgi:putative transposase
VTRPRRAGAGIASQRSWRCASRTSTARPLANPTTQGKIERYHRSMKNVVRLENPYSPWELERAVARFVDHYNHERLHEAIGTLTPDDMYHGRQREICTHREKIKRLTLQRRKKENLHNAA